MKKAIYGTFLAVLVLLFTTALGLALIHITDFPFTADIKILQICENTGLSQDEVMANYDAVMEYLSPFTNQEFSLPTLGYTAVSAVHFEDCKIIFRNLYIIGFFAAVLLIFLAVKRTFSRNTLRISGVITIAIPALFALGAYIDFDRMFVVFHHLFFNGDSWLFDPQKDQIINILPETFFMHCALFIALFWVFSSAVQLIIGYRKSKR